MSRDYASEENVKLQSEIRTLKDEKRSLVQMLAAKDAEIERLRNVLGRPELLENLAATEHERWSGWMKYQAEKTGKTHPVSGEVYEDRWKRQSQTAYAQLPEAERESDRIEARKTLAIIRAALANAAPEHKPETCVWRIEDGKRAVTGCYSIVFTWSQVA